MAHQTKLVREVDAHQQEMSIDIFDYEGWKVRISAYDGISPMPSIFDLLPGGASEKAAIPLYEKTVAKYRAEGWGDALSGEAAARVKARIEAWQAAERAREEDLARRLKAFPVSKQDRLLAAAIAKPAGVRELNLRGADGEVLTVIPKSVKKLAALEVLRAEGNRLEELPEELGACKELREIHLAGNALREVPVRIHALKRLAVIDLRNNVLTRIYVRPKTPMRLELGGNPLEPAVQDKLTSSTLGDFVKLIAFSVDTDRLFPIDFTFFQQDYPGVKVLPTEHIVLYGRAPTGEEGAALAKLFPKARVEHRARIDLGADATNAPKPSANAAKPSANAPKRKARATPKPRPLHAQQVVRLEAIVARAKKAKLDAKVKKVARASIELFTKPATAKAPKVGQRAPGRLTGHARRRRVADGCAWTDGVRGSARARGARAFRSQAPPAGVGCAGVLRGPLRRGARPSFRGGREALAPPPAEERDVQRLRRQARARLCIDDPRWGEPAL